MSTALYRRYRPETFEDVIGQEHVTNPLMTALQKNRVNHAYLFSGPRGCGKTTSARILARCLNCAEGPTAHPCGVCPSCTELARGGAGSLDVIEMDAASHGGVDHARDLRERATFAPVRDRYKIFIIDEAHMVTREGFNALLKIVEEPPEHIKFIFATTEPNKVLGTIRSRTHHYPFRLVAPEVLRGYLNHLCDQEGIQVEQGVLPLVVRAGGGSVRDSLSVLDQLMAGASDGGITYDLAVALLGFTHAELLDGVVDAFAAGDSPAVFHAVDRVVQTGQDPRRFVEDLLERFRDLIIVKAVPESAAQILHGMPEDQIDRMRGQATQLGSSELSRAADIANTALTEMTGATSPQLHLELLCARILLPTADDTSRGVNARVDRLERRINLGSVGAVPAPLQSDPAAVTTPETPAQHLAARADGGQSSGPDQPPAPEQQAQAAARTLSRESRGTEQAPEGPTAEAVPTDPPADRATTNGGAGSATQTAAPREPVDPSAHPEERASAAPQQTPPSSPDAGQVTMIERSWTDVVDAVGAYSKVGRATFRECRPTRFEGGVLFVTSTGPGIGSRVERFAPALGKALKDVLGLECSVALDDDRPGGGPTGGSADPGGGPGAGGTGPGPQEAPRSAEGMPAAGRPGGNAPDRGAGNAAPDEDWPSEASWSQAARQAQSPDRSASGNAADASATPRPSRQSQGSHASGPIPAAPEGDRGGEEAWQKHGTPRTAEADSQDPAWSDDSSGESFSGWKVARIPEDDSDRVEEQQTREDSADLAATEASSDARSASATNPNHLHVVKENETAQEGRTQSDDGEPASPTAPAAPATESAGREQAQEPSPQTEASASSDADDQRPSHDWSAAARRAGAPGAPVDGKKCGWRYSGPESAEGASEHPSKWAQRTPHLAEVDGSAHPTEPNAQDSRNDTSRHLHAVRDEASSDDGTARPSTRPTEQGGPVADSANPGTPFRERHAGAIAAGASGPEEPTMVRGRHGDVPVDPNAQEPPEDEWEGFVPSPHDEDIEDSSVFGQAAIEAILGGRVLEERPHHRG